MLFHALRTEASRPTQQSGDPAELSMPNMRASDALDALNEGTEERAELVAVTVEYTGSGSGLGTVCFQGLRTFLLGDSNIRTSKAFSNTTSQIPIVETMPQKFFGCCKQTRIWRNF